MKKYFLSISLTFFLALFFVACEKDNEKPAITPTNDEIIAGNDMAEYEFSALSNFVDAEMSQSTGAGRYAEVNSSSLLPNCATSTYNDVERILTINFGTEDCLCSDGRTRRGKIIASFKGEFNTSGATTTITTEDYYVNDHLYSGVRTVERTSNSGENLTFDIHVNGAITFPDKDVFTWNSERTIVRTAGNETPINFTDDVLETTGTASGVNRNSTAYTATIMTPLKRKITAECFRHFVSGMILIETENDFSMTLNYDPENNEACDDKAVVVFGENVHYVTLK